MNIWLVLDLWNADDWGLWVAGAHDSEEAARAYVQFYGPDNRYKIVCVPINPGLDSNWRAGLFDPVSRNERRADIMAVN